MQGLAFSSGLRGLGFSLGLRGLYRVKVSRTVGPSNNHHIIRHNSSSPYVHFPHSLLSTGENSAEDRQIKALDNPCQVTSSLQWGFRGTLSLLYLCKDCE